MERQPFWPKDLKYTTWPKDIQLASTQAELCKNKTRREKKGTWEDLEFVLMSVSQRFVTVSALTTALMYVYQHHGWIRALTRVVGPAPLPCTFARLLCRHTVAAACSSLSVCSLWWIACQAAAECRSHQLTETLSHQSQSRLQDSSGKTL